MLASAIAFTLTHTVHYHRPDVASYLQTVADTDERPAGAVGQAHQLEVALLDELEIEPVVDVLREDDPELKRAAIEAITQQRGASTVRLLRSLLHDPSPEARFFSSIALSKLEDEISRSILAAQRAVKDAPDDGPAHEQLAQLYLDYAVSGFLEGVTREYYLDLARQTFEEALAASRAPEEVQRRLAQVHLLSGNIAEAALLLDELTAAQPDNLDIHLLRMDAIYQFRDFRELAVYAQRRLPGVTAESDEAELLKWWATAGQTEAPIVR
jgi:HEAT repeat protein